MSVTVNGVVSHTVWVCGAQCHCEQCCFTYCLGVWSTMSYHCELCCFTYCLGVWSTVSVTLDSVVSLTV